MSSPSVSIVVATHNRVDRLRRLVAAVERLDSDGLQLELVICDDGSRDGTAQLLAGLGGELAGGVSLRVVTNPEPLGPAAARDRGWRASGGEVVAFTDDDCEPQPGWLLAAVEALDGERFFVQGRTAPNPAELDRSGPFSRTIEVPALDPGFQTANVIYPRGLLERIGGFDTEAFGREPGGEDSDLGWRAIEAGALPVFQPDALVYHAVERLGPLGKLRVAARWATPMRSYVRHPGLRRAHFDNALFWKAEHRWLAVAAAGAALSRSRFWWLGLLVSLPYARALRARAIIEDGSGRRLPVLAPFFVAHDLTEIVTAIRASARHGRLML